MTTERYLDKIINGDCVSLMQELDNESVNLIVTSPPYDNLRKYTGYDFELEEIIKQMYRITKIGGVEGLVVRRGSIGIDGDMHYDEDHLYGYEALDCLNYDNYEIEFKKRRLDRQKLHTESTS